MKKTRWIVLLRDIRKTWVSFLSVIVFVSLGVAIFLGIKWNEPALSQAMDRYLDEHRYHDLQMVFDFGIKLSEKQLAKVRKGIAKLERNITRWKPPYTKGYFECGGACGLFE